MRPDQEQHLQLLAVFHYVVAGLLALVACIPFIHLALGLGMLLAPHTFGRGHDVPPPVVGWLFVLLGGAFIAAGWTVAALLAWAGRCLQRRRHYTFCLVMAAVACLFMPFGTVLGIFTLILLSNPEVKAAFVSGPSAP